MLIAEIETNASDLAGGELIRQKLDKHQALLVTLNVIDTMMLELAAVTKQKSSYKADLTLVAGAKSGTIDMTAFALDSKFVRWRYNDTDRWQYLDVVEEIEDLTDDENMGRTSILFSGLGDETTYYLSFTPTASMSAEIWGKAVQPEIVDIADAPPFPPEFSLVAAYRIADFILNQLLLIDAKAYSAFVVAQKNSIATDARRCELIWLKFRAGVSDSVTRTTGKSYNYIDEFDGDIDDSESFVHYLG